MDALIICNFLHTHCLNIPVDVEECDFEDFRRLLNAIVVPDIYPLPEMLARMTRPDADFDTVRELVGDYFLWGEEMPRTVDLINAINHWIYGHDEEEVPMILCDVQGGWVALYIRVTLVRTNVVPLT
jgi:hypothetical protein